MLRRSPSVLALIAALAAPPGRPAAPAPGDTSASRAEVVTDPAILWRFDTGG